MTDFLTRLAERTLGLTPRVQPLLASRYAPGPAVPDFPDTLGEEQALAPTRPADPLQAPTPWSRDGALSTLESVLPHRVPETQAIFGATEAVAKASLAPDETNSLAATSAARDASPSAESLRDRPSQPVRAPPPASPDRRGETASARPFRALAAPDVMVPASQLAQNHAEPRAASLLLSPVPQVHLEGTNGGRGVDRPVVERAARRADVVRPLPAAIAADAKPVLSADEPGPPVIRVTIGRVEVRAILPPAPAAQRPVPARTSPALSLDAYLKQSNGGQR